MAVSRRTEVLRTTSAVWLGYASVLADGNLINEISIETMNAPSAKVIDAADTVDARAADSAGHVVTAPDWLAMNLDDDVAILESRISRKRSFAPPPHEREISRIEQCGEQGSQKVELVPDGAFWIGPVIYRVRDRTVEQDRHAQTKTEHLNG
jgi:hypothetical protein